MSESKYPLVRCYNPRRIVNPYTHESMIVPCGHCAACALNRASFLTQWCELESQAHKYTVFITLTYANRYIPRSKLVCSLDRPFAYDIVDKDGEILANIDLSEEKVEALLKKFYLFGDIPYLRKDDLQKFFKRFRYYVGKTSKAKVRYFACGEYGPRHFRPHYHILLWFDDPAILQVCQQVVLASWPFGRVDVQLATGTCSSYVAGYVNSSVSLPEFFKAPAIKPFCVHSCRLGYSILSVEREKVYKMSADDFIKRSLLVNGKYREVSLSRAFYSFYFPRCKGFANKSRLSRIESYRIYFAAKQAFGDTGSCLALAKEIALTCYYFPPQLDKVPFDALMRKVLYYFHDATVHSEPGTPEFDRYVQRIYVELLVSKHFINFCCYGKTDFETVNRMVGIISDFYNRLDYLHLKDFFETQSMFYASNLYGSEDLLSDDFENSFYPYFYNNVNYDLSNYQTTPAYQLMKAETAKLCYDRIKHKVLNDENKIFFDND